MFKFGVHALLPKISGDPALGGRSGTQPAGDLGHHRRGSAPYLAKLNSAPGELDARPLRRAEGHLGPMGERAEWMARRSLLFL